MPEQRAPILARIRQCTPALGSFLLCMVLAGCAASKDDAAALLPPFVGAPKQQAQSAVVPPLETGSLPAKTPPTPKAAGQEVAAAMISPSGSPDEKTKAGEQELYVDFQAESVALSDREKAALREAVAARVLSGWSRISISAARGGTGNLFDQAIKAEKRARVVNEIIPNRMIELVEFDPTLPEDTVRLEFKRPPPAKS